MHDDAAIVGHIGPQNGPEGTPDTTALTGEPEAPKMFLWQWTPEAITAFMQAAFPNGDTKRIKIPAGMSAAMSVDGPPIFHAQVAQLVEYLSTDPLMSERVLKLKPGPDGFIYLKCDGDLVRFILLNTLDPAVDARLVEEGLDEQLKEELAEQDADLNNAQVEGADAPDEGADAPEDES